MRTLVLFKSRYGATKQYAQWLAEDLQADLCEITAFDPKKLADYSTVLFGGGLYAGSINGIALFTKLKDALAGKKLAVFACGLSDIPTDEKEAEQKQNILNALPEDMRPNVAVFYLRGAVDFAKLTFLHRMIMSMVVGIMRKKHPEAVQGDGRRQDYVSRDKIAPIQAFCRQ